ncbi:MAG: glycosyl hydrolase family 8 [Verrucomicrobiae bacterium]
MKAAKKNLLAILAAAGLVVGGLCFWLAAIYDPWRLPRQDWREYQRRFISPEGRVIDTGNGNVTHSEGQGYGMLLAEAYGDRETFDRLWKWTTQNLQTRPDDKLLSWLWKPSEDGGGAIADPNNASDGELLVAWALVRASKRWTDYSYAQSAAALLAELRRLALADSPQGPELLPGSDGFIKENGTVLNPSYYVFPAFDTIEKSFPGGGWSRLGTSGLALIASARFGKWSLTPDWVLADSGSYSLGAPFPPDFGYNAIRVPLHIAWHDPHSPLLIPFADFWKTFPAVAGIPATVNLESNAFGPNPALPGMQTVASFVLACRSNSRFTVRDIPPLMPDEPYFSASLKLLTKVAVRESLGGKR